MISESDHESGGSWTNGSSFTCNANNIISIITYDHKHQMGDMMSDGHNLTFNTDTGATNNTDLD